VTQLDHLPLLFSSVLLHDLDGVMIANAHQNSLDATTLLPSLLAPSFVSPRFPFSVLTPVSITEPVAPLYDMKDLYGIIPRDMKRSVDIRQARQSGLPHAIVIRASPFVNLQIFFFREISFSLSLCCLPFDLSVLCSPQIIARLVDGSVFDEFKQNYGSSLVTGMPHHTRYEFTLLPT